MSARDDLGKVLVNFARLANLTMIVYVPLVFFLLGTRSVNSIVIADYTYWIIGFYAGLNILSALVQPNDPVYAGRDKFWSWFAAIVIWATTALVLVPVLADMVHNNFALFPTVLPARANVWLLGASAFAVFDVTFLQHDGRRDKYGLNREGGTQPAQPSALETPLPRAIDLPPQFYSTVDELIAALKERSGR